MTLSSSDLLDSGDLFQDRHIGPRPADIDQMLADIGMDSIEQLLEKTVPDSIRFQGTMNLDEVATEAETLTELEHLATRNQQFRSHIGTGYHDCITPPAIQRGILEAPGWYTAYTPYQPEISQGRLEALLNFQTMICDLTGMEVANSSMLDEGTAAAEAMAMCHRIQQRARRDETADLFFISQGCHPQTIEIVRSRAVPLGIEVVIGDHQDFTFPTRCFGMLLQYPDTDGRVIGLEEICTRAHDANALVVVAADPLALTLLRSPGEAGADMVVGSTQRFGIPMGFGGPHAAYLGTQEKQQRQLPGRLVGVSRDSQGKEALRLALQTREQHIRRDRATSNICTSQVLLAVCAGMYAVHHGPEGLTTIAKRVRLQCEILAKGLADLGHGVVEVLRFDTVKVIPAGISEEELKNRSSAEERNLRYYGDGAVGITFDETCQREDILSILRIFGATAGSVDLDSLAAGCDLEIPEELARNTEFLTHPVFHRYRSEMELVRYMHRLENKDLALNTAMIPLGSCTMKLNAAAEMFPILYPGFSRMHPFAPKEQTAGYQVLFDRLELWLQEITGFDAVSLMPNAGSQGEYAGLMVIREYHETRGDKDRKVCFIPQSAHGTNPASATMAGMEVVVVSCDSEGNISIEDLEAKIAEHGTRCAALMVTYPSTHGVFETSIQQICDLIHETGGQVYLDGANMNAMVGLCRPGDIGADVCHLNLHKTFCIPHGGGGPGMGPIGVLSHLAPFLPGHPERKTGGKQAIGAISAAPFGSAMILPISYAYIRMMGASGLRRATEVAILSANYLAKKLQEFYPVLYRGAQGQVAHECIIDTRILKESAGISVDDVAKRLIDYGFHAPTMSWPVAGTLMIEPTESESKQELDRFISAMIGIHAEAKAVEEGTYPAADHPLCNAPHTAEMVSADQWDHPYSREKAGYPGAKQKANKFWPAVSRIDQAFGDRNLVCSCPPVEEYLES
ncbi:MAG TPA: aminomethyl-transferring glycine dehydrogenase [Planctomycetes bacterium]|nr:aminomethyl-transferring glycine dehydrogenase [Planctomycetota bacterium]HIK82180.1 glycine dehydrogenase (aminomethyl-transferring) [Planctomycetota bacterium]